MRRFDYDDNEEHREDVDKFFGGMDDEGDAEFISADEYKEMMQEQQAVQQLQIDLANRDLNDRLLFRVIKMLEKGFWWRFYSLDTKMRKIEKAYRRLKRINEKE